MADWLALRDAVAGEVVLPDSPDYELARKPAILNFHDARPQAVVRCTSAADVVEAVGYATLFGLPFAVRSGGHCFAGRSSGDGVVLDLSRMRSVAVSDGVATVGAGALLEDVYGALAAHGLTLPAGCGPDVGIGGLTLGGGFGILGRKYGLTSDQLLAAEVVLADGSVATCDERREPELFWALRGAGGCRFGVVTSFVFATIPEPETTCFLLSWPHTEAAELIAAWQEWSPNTPDELAASLLLTAGDDAPRVHVFGAMQASEADAGQILAELVERAGVGEPPAASRTQLRYADAKRYLAEHGPGDHDPGLTFSKSEYFRDPLPAEAIAALVEGFAEGRGAGEARVLDFSPWGGAYNRVPEDATAFAHRNARFILKHEVILDPGASAARQEAARRWLGWSWECVHPWGTGGVYPNFPDPDLDDWTEAYHGANLERLLQVKRRYDPNRVFD